jgi:hypothetical protein
MEYAFAKQPAYVQALALIRDIDEKIRYVNRNRNNRIPEMERLLESLMQVAVSVARAHAGSTPDFHTAYMRRALENTLSCCPLLTRISQMEIITPNEQESFRQQLDSIIAELKALLPDSGV